MVTLNSMWRQIKVWSCILNKKEPFLLWLAKAFEISGPVHIVVFPYIDSCTYIHIYAGYIPTQWQQTSEDFFNKICTSHFIVSFEKGYSRFACERELEIEQNCNILTPTLMAVNVVSFSFSRAAQLEAQGPTLLDDGFLYCILSATSLDPNSSGPQGPPPPCFSTTFCLLTRLISNCLTSVLTELYDSSTLTQSPTQSLEWHV